MITIVEATKLAESHLNSAEVLPNGANYKIVILGDMTQEKSWGWIFYWDSSRHLETQNCNDALLGGGPLFVNRDSGELYLCGSGFDVEHYVKEYEDRLINT